MSIVFDFIEALPALLKLFQSVRASIKAAEADRKISEDIKTIHEAFDTNDATKLNALFSTPISK